MLCEYGCGQQAKFVFKNGKHCCSKNHQQCPHIKEKQSGKNHPMYGVKRTHSKETRMKMSNSAKKRKRVNILTIEKIKQRHPTFYKVEEMRYNPDKPGKKEIQVHCKNHNCPNSKEQGGWFTPTKRQIYDRRQVLESSDGFGESNFYCSDKCKSECPLYGLKSDPFKNNESISISEYNVFREYVLERDDYKCQYCGKITKYVHHERPQKLEPFFVLDPDLAWSVCKKCHYKYGHKDECSTGNIATILC